VSSSVEPIVVTDTEKRTVSIRLASDQLVVTETRYAAGEKGPDLHVHHQHVDCFYVLEGMLTLSLEDGERTLGAKSFVLVPPDVVHTFRNDGPGELRFFNFHAPGLGFDRYLRGLYDEEFAVPFDQHPAPESGGRDPNLVIAGKGELVAERPSLDVVLLADAPELGISSSRGAAGGPSPPPHIHPRHAESFHMLEGEMLFTVDGNEVHAAAGSWVHVPPATVHSFSFPGSDDVRFLSVHTPSCGFGTFLRALADARNDDDLVAARAAFDQEAT
jgi:quercetin dioxygenase-like cupin family protein